MACFRLRSSSYGGQVASLAMTLAGLFRKCPAVARDDQFQPKSSLAPMVNRVLTSPYLWWFDRFPMVAQILRPLLKVLAFQTWQ
jgi:hypothetical protein